MMNFGCCLKYCPFSFSFPNSNIVVRSCKKEDEVKIKRLTENIKGKNNIIQWVLAFLELNLYGH